MDFLTPERALIFRITHFDNVAWILRHGLQCRNSPLVDPNFTEIGRPEIIDRRRTRRVDILPGGTLSDYVPFYFNSKTPMLLNIRTGWQGLQKRAMSEIVILYTSLRDLAANNVPFIFSDRSATLITSEFDNDLSKLDDLPWDLWRVDNFRRDDSRPDKIELYLAEALVHRSLSVEWIKGIVCYSEQRKVALEELVSGRDLAIPIYVRKGWYC